MLDIVWLLPALPLAGFVVLLLSGRRLGDPRAGWLATTMVAASFAVAAIVCAGALKPYRQPLPGVNVAAAMATSRARNGTAGTVIRPGRPTSSSLRGTGHRAGLPCIVIAPRCSSGLPTASRFSTYCTSATLRATSSARWRCRSSRTVPVRVI